MSLSLPLTNENQVAGLRRDTLSVEGCLTQFIAPEKLSGIHCPTCREKTVTSKQHVVARLPKILCLHLKRFDASYNKKIEDFVSFPLKGLDMGPYLPHWCVYTSLVSLAASIHDLTIAIIPGSI
jgi:ubiquitin carboxyl-terminal hydrolase 22/27/51